MNPGSISTFLIIYILKRKIQLTVNGMNCLTLEDTDLKLIGVVNVIIVHGFKHPPSKN